MKNKEKENEKEATITFTIIKDDELEFEKILHEVYNAMREKGYENPQINMCGYFVSGDPSYITNYKDARSRMCSVERYELLNYLIKKHFKNN